MSTSIRLLIAQTLWVLLLSHAPIAGAFNPPYSAPTWDYISDDFEDDDVPSASWQTVLGTWSIANGTYNSSTAVSSAVTTIFDYPDFWYSGPVLAVPFGDYRLRARMLNQSAAGSTVGLVYHYQDAANYREALFSASGTASLRVVVDGLPTTVASAPYQGGGQGVWFDVELLVDAGTSTVRVNGIDLLTRIATPMVDLGQAGLSTHNALAKFDNFHIEFAVGEPPFQEDFEDGTSQHLSAQAGQWSAAAGTYNSTVQQTSIALTPVAGDFFVMRNFTLRTRMLNPYAAAGNLVGIVFNYGGSGDYDEAVFSPTGVARINRVRGGTVETVATTTYDGRRNAWFDVTFYLLDTFVSVAVDGQLLFDRVPNPNYLPEGSLGLITHWAPGKFDDVWFGYTEMMPFAEGFDAGLPSGWSVNGTWSANQGILDATTVAVTASAAAPASAPRDYVLRARMLNQYGAAGNLVGLMYQGSASQGKGDRFEVVFAPTGQAYLDKYIQGVRHRTATATHSIPRNTWFNVELTRSGPDTTVKVNGVTLFNHVPQGQLPSSSFGLVTHWAKARFDNVSLSPLPK